MPAPASGAASIAYAGEPGAFAEDAVLAAFGDVERASLGSFREVFDAVAAGDAAAGVVPIENVINGTVRENYDLLLEFELMIRGEVVVPVSLCLAALPGQRIEDIERVYSHIQALGQAEAFLRRRSWQLLTTYNTAGAGKAIADRAELGAAAVLSPRAAGLFGLEVLVDEIGDLAGNRTRFLVLARPDAPPPPLRDDHAPPPDDAGRGRQQRAGHAPRGPPRLRRPPPEHAQARVASEPRASLGVRLLDRPRRRHGGWVDGGGARRARRRDHHVPRPRLLPGRDDGLTPPGEGEANQTRVGARSMGVTRLQGNEKRPAIAGGSSFVREIAVRPDACAARPGSRSGASPRPTDRPAVPP